MQSNIPSSQPSLLGQWHQELAEEHLKRDALEMCCTTVEQQVVSSEYFYSMVESLNGVSAEKCLLRPKKFKEIKKLYGSDPQYQILSSKKKVLRQSLFQALQEQKPQSLKRLLIIEARAGRPFSDLGLPDIDQSYAQKIEALKKAYEAYQDFYLKNSAKAAHLRHVFDVDNLLKYQQERVEFRKKKLANWDSLKTSIYAEIERAWPKCYQEMYEMRKAKVHARDVPREFTRAVEKHFQNMGDTRNGCYQIICEFIWEGLEEIVKGEKDTSIIDGFCEKHSNLIQAYADAQIEQDKAKVSFILKEQKQHALARFCQLTDNYETFIRHAKMIEEMAEQMEPKAGGIVRKTLGRLLKHSHYATPNEQEIKNIEDRLLDKKVKMRIEEKEKAEEKLNQLKKIQQLISVKDTHHKSHVMGYEKDGYFSPEDKPNAIRSVNMCLQLLGKEKEVTNFQHAHTFPFPAMFNWKPAKMREFLAEQGAGISEEFRPPERYISSKFFKIAREGISQHDLDSAFKEELNKILVDAKSDKGIFIYCALDLLKHYHFKVFSETELVPDFINIELDQLSEWATSDDNYKQCIALSLRRLIKDQQSVSKELVAASLQPYHVQIGQKISGRVIEWKKDRNSIYNLVHRIGAIQIQQAQLLGQLQSSSKVASAANEQLSKSIQV